MREIYCYASATVFMCGFVLLVVLHAALGPSQTIAFVFAIYLMTSGALMAALVSCLEPVPKPANHETRQLMSHETEELDEICSRSSTPTDVASA